MLKMLAGTVTMPSGDLERARPVARFSRRPGPGHNEGSSSHVGSIFVGRYRLYLQHHNPCARDDDSRSCDALGGREDNAPITALGRRYVWSLAYSIVDAAPAGTNLVYFAFVNYTTLGYGDVTPVKDWLLLGPMAAMNGVLLFGWSTAVFEVLRRAMMRLPGTGTLE